MATTSSAPILYSVLTSSHDNNEDFVNQLRNHLHQIETNVQQTLNKIQQRKPYTSLQTITNKVVDSTIRNNFFDVLKDVAIKNNTPFDEPFFRQQILDKQISSPSLKVDVVRAKSSITNDTNDQHLSPVNNTRRSQFAPVLSSTPVHQTSPITPIPIDLTMATPSVPPVLILNSTDIQTVLPSAIAPQRAKIGRTAGRPPRIPRGESVTRQKKISSSIINEQQEEIIVAKEIYVSSKHQIKSKQEIIEDNIEIIIKQQNEILPDINKQVETTPLRGKRKKIIQDNLNIIPQSSSSVEQENQIITKKTRNGRNKKKDEEVKITRTASLRNRNKKEEVIIIPEEDIPVPSKRTTRNKKLIEPIINAEENLPLTKIRATPSRSKKKPSLEIVEPIIVISPKKPITKSKKRKVNDDTNDNQIDTVQPSSPKRRFGRNTRSKNSSRIETIITPPLIEQEPPQQQQPISTRSSRRGKKDIVMAIEKQEDIVLNKKSRAGRPKKPNEPINTDNRVTAVDVVMTSVTASIPSSSSMNSLVSKPPRPPIARKKKSLAMPPLPQTSPLTPPQITTQRIQSTSPINDKPLLPLPTPTNNSRRRQPQRRIINSPIRTEKSTLETLPSNNHNQKRTRSSVTTTPKRIRRDDLMIISVPSTPGKKRNKCTCQKRRNKICDICAAAIDN
ncbi:unnamed protein product [Rotaria sordida]|uniref:Uncharacterized protein n=1 Tax=Rotaria sordida TaxID=392033 RepID=A0A813YIU2_9BILA|nr:unnamed protein product [Rotaria sordida]CAF0884760.1 unnamed protein product [Rotaria sordida]